MAPAVTESRWAVAEGTTCPWADRAPAASKKQNKARGIRLMSIWHIQSENHYYVEAENNATHFRGSGCAVPRIPGALADNYCGGCETPVR